VTFRCANALLIGAFTAIHIGMRWFRTFPALASIALVAVSFGCSVRSGPSGRDAGPPVPIDGSVCEDGDLVCGPGETVQRCMGGERVDVETCSGDFVCAEGLGCVTCRPGFYQCQGSDLYVCNSAGDGYDLEASCAGDEICTAGGLVGMCAGACEEAIANRSNIGCTYWAVDLDNEEARGIASNDAWSQPFAVAIANPSDVTATVRVFLNDAPVGAVPVERQVFMGQVMPRDVLEIRLDQREVDGPMDVGPDERGTWLSSHAYRIESNYPVVAYQFNPIIQDFSNDASLLLPQSGLDTEYRVLGWPTANPVELGGIDIEGIPDHSYVTIVGTQPNTEVTVTLGGDIVGDQYGLGIGPASAGETVTWTLGPFDVLNLESDGIPGDMTGTVVQSTHPVVVFSGGERGLAPVSMDGIPVPPSGEPDNVCCTEHLEEQVYPTTAWGRDFVMTRSPQRGRTWAEPDIYRVMADRVATNVTTNLPGADASFTPGPGEWREFYAQESFVMRADAPVSIEQILVSQAWVADWRSGHGGDPSMILFPPFQQYREDYVFLTPSTFSADYVVISMPVGTSVLLDGEDINGDEFMMLCTYELAGEIDGTMYQAVTCPVEDGAHTIDATMPVGISVYGYYNVGSYGYAGGSDLEQINPLI